MRKGQFAMEYFLVIGFSLVIITPMIFLLHNEYSNVRSDVHREHVSELSRELIYQAEKLYYQGPPSQTTMTAYFPPGLTDVREENNTYLVFEFEDGREINTWSRVPINVSLRTFSGQHNIVLSVKRSETGVYVEIRDDD